MSRPAAPLVPVVPSATISKRLPWILPLPTKPLVLTLALLIDSTSALEPLMSSCSKPCVLPVICDRLVSPRPSALSTSKPLPPSSEAKLRSGTTKVSLPPIPLRVSAPPLPVMRLLPSLPVRMLAPLVPVALMLADPVKIRFSKVLPNTQVTEERTVSLP